MQITVHGCMEHFHGKTRWRTQLFSKNNITADLKFAKEHPDTLDFALKLNLKFGKNMQHYTSSEKGAVHIDKKKTTQKVKYL